MLKGLKDTKDLITLFRDYNSTNPRYRNSGMVPELPTHKHIPGLWGDSFLLVSCLLKASHSSYTKEKG